MEPPPEAYLRLAVKCHSVPLKVRLILQAFASRERQQPDGAREPKRSGVPLSTELRAAVLSLPDSNLTRQRLMPALLAHAMEQDARLPRAVFPGKTDVRTTTEATVHAALSREPATARQLAAASGIPLSTVRDTLASLAAGGWVAHSGRGSKDDPFLYYKIK